MPPRRRPRRVLVLALDAGRVSVHVATSSRSLCGLDVRGLAPLAEGHQRVTCVTCARLDRYTVRP